MTSEILLIGLDLTGTSTGLALKEAELESTLTGFDPHRDTARHAQKIGAVDRLTSNLQKPARSADLVLISGPSIDARDYLKDLGPILKPEAVLLNLTSHKLEAAEWAKEYLAEGSHYVGATPIVGPKALSTPLEVTEGDPTLFSGGLMAISVLPNTSERAVAGALNLAQILEASPFFIDIAEHDGVMASVEDLPQLIGAVLAQVALKSPAWREVQRIAGQPFTTAISTGTLSPPDELSLNLSLNRQNVLDKLDALQMEIHRLREIFASEDWETLQAYLGEVFESRNELLGARERGDWTDEDTPQTQAWSEMGDVLKNLFGMRKRRPSGDTPTS